MPAVVSPACKTLHAHTRTSLHSSVHTSHPLLRLLGLDRGRQALPNKVTLGLLQLLDPLFVVLTNESHVVELALEHAARPKPAVCLARKLLAVIFCPLGPVLEHLVLPCRLEMLYFEFAILRVSFGSLFQDALLVILMKLFHLFDICV